jgi:hypothetical protein
VWGTSDKVGNVRVLEDVLFGCALFRVTARRDEGRGVVGHVGNHFAVAKGMRTEPSLARGCEVAGAASEELVMTESCVPKSMVSS